MLYLLVQNYEKVIMPKSKNAEQRYRVLDKCFSDFRKKYTFADLLESVNEKLYDVYGSSVTIKTRQLRDDISNIRKLLPQDVYLDSLPSSGKECYYRYSEKDFSLYTNQLSDAEIQNLRSTIEMLGRFRDAQSNAWLEEVISNLEVKFGVKANAEMVVSFQQNEQLKGLQYLSTLIDATVNKQTLEIEYISASGNKHTHILHPYYVKQYNNRWFLYGLDDNEERIKNLAFDRMQHVNTVNIPFRKNTFVDFNTYFDNVLGVTVPYNVNEAVITIQLKFTPNRFEYVKTKPLHKSQTIVSEENGIISITVCPTRELEQQLFSFGPDVEILSPAGFRDDFAKKIAENVKLYFPMQKDCIDCIDLCQRKQNV